MDNRVLYNRSAEKNLQHAGVNIFSYEKRCRQYVQVLSMRRDAMKRADETMFRYAFSLDVDKEKHQGHDAAVSVVKELNSKCAELGFELIYGGDIDNRQQIGAFACLFTGEPELAELAD